MHCRFATKYDPLDFTPEDNISVGIERNIRGNEPAKVDIPLKPKDVIVPRRRDEGQVMWYLPGYTSDFIRPYLVPIRLTHGHMAIMHSLRQC